MSVSKTLGESVLRTRQEIRKHMCAVIDMLVNRGKPLLPGYQYLSLCRVPSLSIFPSSLQFLLEELANLPLLPCSHLGGLPLPVHSWQWEELPTPVAMLEKKGSLLTPVTFQSLGLGSFCLHWHPHLSSLGLISAALCVVGLPCSPNRPFLGVCESAGF